ncbi:hypothetical protein SKAU_G00402970 [Synaphobranchus kaupii]|uniref:Uncharacterized protein n=1 Tax=Synaphobranchus kaupii TaxID=118154 RepID=A0A9Q1E9G9_SYNKA|nr:hypothetical protein SKAU_G00402970 [Synaphobranchus kaupii]
MVQQEFRSLSKEHNIRDGGPEIHEDSPCRGEDPDDSKQDGTSTEESQRRSAGKLQNRAQGQKGKRGPWLPVVEEFPPLPCPAQPWNGRVCQGPAAVWPPPPAPNNAGGTQNVKEIQDFLRKVLLKPGQEGIPPNRQVFIQGQPIPKGTVQTERPDLLCMLTEKSAIPEAQTRPCQPHTAGVNHDPNADGLRADLHSFGTTDDGAKRPAGPRDDVKRHPCLERTTRPENVMTDNHPKRNSRDFKSVPPRGAAEPGGHLRNTALPGPRAIGAPPADKCQTRPVRPPPGFQPLQRVLSSACSRSLPLFTLETAAVVRAVPDRARALNLRIRYAARAARLLPRGDAAANRRARTTQPHSDQRLRGQGF